MVQGSDSMEKRFLEVCIRNRNLLGLTIEDVADILDVRPTIYEKFEKRALWQLKLIEALCMVNR